MSLSTGSGAQPRSLASDRSPDFCEPRTPHLERGVMTTPTPFCWWGDGAPTKPSGRCPARSRRSTSSSSVPSD